VENTNRSFSNIGNEQYIPTDVRLSFTTNNIEDLFDLFDVSEAIKNTPITDDANPYYAFFKSESNPFIAEFVTTQNNAADQFGLLNIENQGVPTYKKYENLAILETAPTVSRLDLFYETSTAGLINDLNTAVAL
jgi:hypothetical protein